MQIFSVSSNKSSGLTFGPARSWSDETMRCPRLGHCSQLRALRRLVKGGSLGGNWARHKQGGICTPKGTRGVSTIVLFPSPVHPPKISIPSGRLRAVIPYGPGWLFAEPGSAGLNTKT